MKVLFFVLSCIYTFTASANEQFFTPMYLDEREPGLSLIREFPMSISAKVFPQQCTRASMMRANGPSTDSEEFSKFIKIVNKITSICMVEGQENDKGDIVSILINNNGSPRINPHGNGEHDSSKRTFRFSFKERSKQDIKLEITDDSALTKRLSHDLLHTTLVFIPRKVMPYVEAKIVNGKELLIMVLPTGEKVIFDKRTNEIIGGALSEKPMDFNPSRHNRKFAAIDYTGKGISIRADRRAGLPEKTHKVAFNKNERSKAVIKHQGKSCYVSKSDIWANSTNGEHTTPYFKYKSDQEFLDQVIRAKCGWNIGLNDL